MKKLNYLFLSAIMTLSMLSFSSCSDDDDDYMHQDKIVGTWTLQDSKTTSECKPAELEAKFDAFYERQVKSSIVFTENNTMQILDETGKSLFNGAYAINGFEIHVTEVLFITDPLPLEKKDTAVEPRKFVIKDIDEAAGTFTLTEDLTDTFKRDTNEAAIWESLKTEKPENFEAIKLVLSHNYKKYTTSQPNIPATKLVSATQK